LRSGCPGAAAADRLQEQQVVSGQHVGHTPQDDPQLGSVGQPQRKGRALHTGAQELEPAPLSLGSALERNEVVDASQLQLLERELQQVAGCVVCGNVAAPGLPRAISGAG
jgi:hypothetical protein